MVNEIEETSLGYLLSPEFELINSAGKPLTGGWIEVYIHGSRNKYYCYSDWSGNLHPFQIPLDSLGANIVLASPAHAYDVYVYNKFGNLVMSRYNVLPQIAGTAVISGSVNIESSDGTVNIEVTGDNNFDISVADIIDSVTANIDESITNIEGDITEINQDITNITNVVTGLPTHADVYDSIVTGIEYVTGMIPEAQVQSDWDETDPTDPAYILNKPDLDIYVTEQELIEVVSGISGLNLEYGQFYCQSTTGGAVMGRTKGNIEVTNDGKIKLKKGQSYHVTVRGGYSKTTASADYGVLSYIEYITGQNINVNVDNSVTDTQYFEISYDLYKLSSDKNYYVFFSLPTGSSVNNLFIEIHSIGCMGTGGSGSGVPVEYDAGWGIDIVDNVISVDSSILNQYVTEGELATAIDNVIDVVTGLIPEAQVQADWDEDNPLDPSYINNKPDLDIYVTDQELIEAISGVTGTFVQEQSDWAEQDSTKVDYIKNKPVEKQLVPGDNIVITESATGVIISSTGGGASGTVQNIVEYVDATTTPNFFNDCVTLLEQGLEPAAMYNGNMYQLWHTEKNGNNYTGLGFICVHYLDFQYSNITYDHQHAWNAQLWADTNGVYPGSDRMGYNYLAGNGIDAVTGIVNGEHAITYSIDPTEVATAISGLLPSAPTYSAGNGIDITNNTISVDNTVALKSDIPDVSNFVTETELQDTAELITGLIPDVSDLATKAELQDNIELVTGMIPDVSNLVSDDELTAAVSGKSDKFVVLEYQGSYTWDYVKGLVDNNILVYCKYNNTMCVLTDVPSSNTGFFTFTGYKVNEHFASKLTDDVIKLKFGRTFTFIQPTWSMSTTKVAAEVLPGTGLTGSYNSTSDIYRISINPEQIAGAISGLLPEGPMYSAGNGIDITNDTISVDNTVALKTDIPDVSDFITSEELQDGLELVTGLIPTDYATKEELQDNIELATGMIPNYTAGDNIDITNNVISVSGTEDLTLMNLTAGEGISITPDVSGNVEIACTSTGVTKTILYTGSSSDSRSDTFTLSQSGYNFDRLEMTLIDVDGYVIKQVCEMPADGLVNYNGTRGSSFNSITSGTQTWFKAMNWQLDYAGNILRYWVDEIATSGNSVIAINRDQASNRPIMLRIYGIKE